MFLSTSTNIDEPSLSFQALSETKKVSSSDNVPLDNFSNTINVVIIFVIDAGKVFSSLFFSKSTFPVVASITTAVLASVSMYEPNASTEFSKKIDKTVKMNLCIEYYYIKYIDKSSYFLNVSSLRSINNDSTSL